MCWCNPSIKTPWCGVSDCRPPTSSISNHTKLKLDTISGANLAMWQSCCDKKMEVEDLQDKLSEAVEIVKSFQMDIILQYEGWCDHADDKDYIRCVKFLESVEKLEKENK